MAIRLAPDLSRARGHDAHRYAVFNPSGEHCPGFRGALVNGLEADRRYRGLEAFQRLRPLLVISRFVSTLLKGDQPVIYGEGEGDGDGECNQTRNFVFVYSKEVVK